MRTTDGAAEIPPLDQLIRAVGHGRYSEVLEAYKACYEIGAPLVSPIVEKIRAGRWKDLGRGEKLRYLTHLMRLLHDIDESASRALTDEILGKGCHPVVAVRLRSIQAFTLKDFEAHTHGPLTIYVAASIARRETVRRYLRTWLGHTPAEDLEDIHRLYVIEPHRLPRCRGNYLRVLSVISIVWWPFYAWNRLTALQAELTFYHEVGHHVDRRESRSTESSEAFADTYAERMFRRVHPRLGKRWIEVFLMPSHSMRKLRRLREMSAGPQKADD